MKPRIQQSVRHGSLLSFLLAFVLLPALDCVSAERLNVLLLASDDMRPQLGCYSDAIVRTPNLDRLVARELYDRQMDPQENVAGRLNNSLVIERLARQLRTARPPVPAP